MPLFSVAALLHRLRPEVAAALVTQQRQPAPQRGELLTDRWRDVCLLADLEPLADEAREELEDQSLLRHLATHVLANKAEAELREGRQIVHGRLLRRRAEFSRDPLQLFAVRHLCGVQHEEGVRLQGMRPVSEAAEGVLARLGSLAELLDELLARRGLFQILQAAAAFGGLADSAAVEALEEVGVAASAAAGATFGVLDPIVVAVLELRHRRALQRRKDAWQGRQHPYDFLARGACFVPWGQRPRAEPREELAQRRRVAVFLRSGGGGFDVGLGGGDVAPAESALQVAVQRPDPADRRRRPQQRSGPESRAQRRRMIAERLRGGRGMDEIDGVVDLVQDDGEAPVSLEELHGAEGRSSTGDAIQNARQELLGDRGRVQPHDKGAQTAGIGSLEHHGGSLLQTRGRI